MKSVQCKERGVKTERTPRCKPSATGSAVLLQVLPLINKGFAYSWLADFWNNDFETPFHVFPLALLFRNAPEPALTLPTAPHPKPFCWQTGMLQIF